MIASPRQWSTGTYWLSSISLIRRERELAARVDPLGLQVPDIGAI